MAIVVSLTASLGLLSSTAAAALRQPNTTLRMPQNLPVIGYGLTNAFENLAFTCPVDIASPPGETNRLFVVERTGRIFVITNLAQPTKTLFLDVTTNLIAHYTESGLLGLAFHPGYSTNGFFYVYRTLFTATANTLYGMHDQLSRFETSPSDPHRALASSERILFAQPDQSDTHNGGGLRFGPDGYLYLTLGDKDPPLSQQGDYKQAIDRGLFAGIIRIDVDNRPGSLPPNSGLGITSHYSIPPDNPFIGLTNYQGVTLEPSQIRTEFYAIGFRNPWRISFDPLTGALYCGDVGEASWEEINLVIRGGNYGWPYDEGASATSLGGTPPQYEARAPLYAYGHGHDPHRGYAVIGGIVYRGSEIPQLVGAYLFGDNVSGHIWALRHHDGIVTELSRLAGDMSISTFGIDPRNGDVLVANHSEGRLKRLIYVPPESVTSLPLTLADTGVFSDPLKLEPSAGILPYEINVPFWSDNAHKRRWFCLPETNTTIEFNASNHWTFPAGSVWIKHFELEMTNGVAASMRRLETRLLVKNAGGVYGVTYRWDDSQTNAVLVPDEGWDESFVIDEGAGKLRNQVWHYPGRNECLSCHNPGAGYVLGFNTAQLNRPVVVLNPIPANQIELWHAAGFFRNGIGLSERWPELASTTHNAYPLQYRVRSYLAANCAQCHYPEGPTGVPWNARINVPLAESGIVEGLSVTREASFRVVKPHSLAQSLAYLRISDPGLERMPPIGSTVLDVNAIDLLAAWITSLPPPPWSYRDIGNAEREGSATLSNLTFRVSGSGTGLGGAQDAFHYLYRPVTNNIQLIAHLAEVTPVHPLAVAGLMVREGLSADARHATIGLTADQGAAFYFRSNQEAEVIEAPGTKARAPYWLRLVREDNAFTGYQSEDGVNWTSVATQRLTLPKNVFAGFAVSAHEPTRYNNSVFDTVSFVAVSLTGPATDAPIELPAAVSLTADVIAEGTQVQRVEFFDGDTKLGEAVAPPYSYRWTNALAGLHTVRARAMETSGTKVFSRGLDISIHLPAAQAAFRASDSAASGAWKTHYGRDGAVIVGDTTNLPTYVQVSSEAAAVLTWDDRPTQARALQRATGPGQIAAAWEAAETLTLETNFRDGLLHQVTLYFLDWDTQNRRRQKVEVFDAASNALLDTRSLSSFSNGTYLTWALRGRVRIKITALAEPSAVVSGLFIDTPSNRSPSVTLASPEAGGVFAAPQTIFLEATAADEDGAIRLVEFLANGLKIGEVTTTPFIFAWSNVLAGDYSLAARAFDQLGDSAVSGSVDIQVTQPAATAAFVGVDANTQGDWKGAYGAEGYAIVQDSTNYPSYTVVSPGENTPFASALYTSEKPALQRVEGPWRIAAYWVAADELALDVNMKDGRTHLMSLYFLEWLFDTRVLAVEIRDARAGDLLDRREIETFARGKYYTWQLRGHVKVRILRLLGGNVVLSGLFFDADPHADWEKPTVEILSPLSGALLINSPMTLVGTAFDNTAVTGVEYRLETAQGTKGYRNVLTTNNWKNWSTTITNLIPGTNLLRVRARDDSGNLSMEATRAVTYISLDHLILRTQGAGTIVPNLTARLLRAGTVHTITAIPASGSVFSNWTGGVTSPMAKLTFVMQPKMSLQANFVPSPFTRVQGGYNGLFYVDDTTSGVRHESSGFLTLRVTGRGSYSGQLLLAGRRHPFVGRLDLEGKATNTVKRSGATDLIMELTLDLSLGTDQINGRVIEAQAGWEAMLLGDRAPIYVGANASPYRGKYTLVIPGSADAELSPVGAGLGTMVVAPNGTLAFSGTLADGTPATQTVPVSKSGWWPLYASLYGGKGSLLSWVTLSTNASRPSLTKNQLSWIKPSLSGMKLYPRGFSNQVEVALSPYRSTVGTNTVLGIYNGQLHVEGGNLTKSFTNRLTLGSKNTVIDLTTNQPLVLNITLPSGRFNGSIRLLDAGVKKTLTFKGALLQEQNYGVGFFLGTNQSGRVFFGP